MEEFALKDTENMGDEETLSTLNNFCRGKRETLTGTDDVKSLPFMSVSGLR